MFGRDWLGRALNLSPSALDPVGASALPRSISSWVRLGRERVSLQAAREVGTAVAIVPKGGILLSRCLLAPRHGAVNHQHLLGLQGNMGKTDRKQGII